MFVWRDYLDVAKLLAAGCNEACWRSAIGRAYYAAFCTARSYVPALAPNSATSHSDVWNQFRTPSGQPEPSGYRAIRDDAKALKQLRIRSDYRDTPPIYANDAENAVRLCENILSALDRLPKPQ